MTIRFNDPHAAYLIASAAKIPFVPQLHHCIAEYDSNDILRGGVLFTDYLGGSVQVHVAGFRLNWASKVLLYLTFQYPFKIIRVKKLIGLVPESNTQARNLNLHLGFKIEYLVADVFNWGDAPNGMYVMSMYAEDCKWLNMPTPRVILAPKEKTNQLTLPLEILDHTQMTVQ
jgi:hypothetical protein